MTLKQGDEIAVLLDPLSHGSNMQSLRIEAEVLKVASGTESVENDEWEAEFELHIAVARVVSQQVVEWGDATKPLSSEKIDSTWGNLVDQIMIWHRIDDGDWTDTFTSQPVDFIEKENK